MERVLANYELFVLYLGNINEPLLRPVRLRRVQNDVQALKDGGSGGARRPTWSRRWPDRIMPWRRPWHRPPP